MLLMRLLFDIYIFISEDIARLFFWLSGVVMWEEWSERVRGDGVIDLPCAAIYYLLLLSGLFTWIRAKRRRMRPDNGDLHKNCIHPNLLFMTASRRRRK